MTDWIYWLLGASTVFAASLILLAWQGLRTSYTRLFLEVFVLWAAAALVLFAVAAALGGAAWAARAAVSVSGVYRLLALLRFRRAR